MQTQSFANFSTVLLYLFIYFVNRISHKARLAQSVERKALNLVVVGSSPTVGDGQEFFSNTTSSASLIRIQDHHFSRALLGFVFTFLVLFLVYPLRRRFYCLLLDANWNL